jgi:hypothetical protein
VKSPADITRFRKLHACWQRLEAMTRWFGVTGSDAERREEQENSTGANGENRDAEQQNLRFFLFKTVCIRCLKKRQG